jgi:hypothetical protein
MKIPTISAKNLWHWGTLQVERKFEAGVSWEGNLFSMSACPEAWRQIARLGGSDLHVRKESTTMLDLHSTLYGKSSNAKALKDLIVEWALDQKLITPQVIYLISWYDDELDDTIGFEFKTKEEAEAELDDDGDREITSSTKLVSTPELNKRHGFKPDEIIGLEYAAIDWAREHIGQRVMGVYWDEKLDPIGLSAPRAGMFNLAELNLSTTDIVPDDHEGLEGISRVKWVDVPQLDNQSSIQP